MRREDTSSRSNQEIPSWEVRLAHAEAEVDRFAEMLRSLRAEWEAQREEDHDIRETYNSLRETVLRYAVACGAVEVQVAMIRARGDNGGELTENLRRSIEEQTEASNALRALARSFQNSGGNTSNTSPR